MDDDAFRAEARAFFESEYPENLRFLPRRLTWAESKPWWMALSKKGWLAPNWPVEHGGMGLEPGKLIIYWEETERAGIGRMPDQGVTSVFSFGRSSGIIEGVLATLALPYTIEPPQAWQKSLNVRGGKDGSRLRATELFPKYADLFARKKDDGRADAALMAWYIATK